MPTYINDIGTKQDYYSTAISPQYKLTAAELNALVDAVKAIRTKLNDDVRIVKPFTITPASFSGGYYDNAECVGLTPDIDFVLFSNEGSGAKLRAGTGEAYQFNSGQGRFTMDPGNYYLLLFKRITLTV